MDTSDIKKGVKFMYDGNPYVVVDFQFVKPGKGQAFTRTKMRQLLTGAVLEKNIRSGEKLEFADAEERTLQFIYVDGEQYVFMNNHTGEQVTVRLAPTTRFTYGDNYVYRFVIDSRSGGVPMMHSDANQDYRRMGVFVTVKIDE